jgi:WhiB family redox-sensing transcriptional regulator
VEATGPRERDIVWSQVTWDAAHWRDQAACQDVSAELFFPVGASGPALDQIGQAKAVCAGCPVADQCLQFAVTTNQEYGVWGGLDEDERRDVRRRWRRELRQQSRAS